MSLLKFPTTTFGRLLLLSAGLLLAQVLLAVLAVRAVGLGTGSSQFSDLIAGNVALAESGVVLPPAMKTHLEFKSAVSPPPNAGPPLTIFTHNVAEGLKANLGNDRQILFSNGSDSHVWLSAPHGNGPWTGVRVPSLIEKTFGAMVLIMVFGLLANVAMAYWFARSLAVPLSRLAMLASALARGESLSDAWPAHGPREVVTLEKALRTAAADVRQSVRDREMMLAGVSHDLCTPLARLRLALELQPSIPSSECSLLQADVDEMSAIIAQFLNYVRDGRDESAVSTNLIPMVDDLIAQAARAGIVWQRRGVQSLICNCRPLSLRRAISNLMHNAELHGAPPFILTLERVNEEVQIVVSDAGPGVPAHWLPKAGHPFSRVNEARGGKPGSGLGLALVSRVAQVHGGRLTLCNLPTGGFEARLNYPAFWALGNQPVENKKIT